MEAVHFKMANCKYTAERFKAAKVKKSTLSRFVCLNVIMIIKITVDNVFILH